MKKQIIGITVLLMIGLSAFAQQDPQYTMYMFNRQMINPAYAGSRDVVSITGLYRKQWVNIQGAPESFNIGAHSPFNPNAKFSRPAAGLLMYSDQISVFNTYGVYGQYAYRFPVTENTIMSLGFQAGVDNFSGRLSELNPRDPMAQDVVINSNIDNVWLPNFGLGGYLYHERYYIGLSVPRLIQNKYNRNSTSTSGDPVAKQYRHYFLMGGVVIGLTEDFKLRPNFLAKYLSNPGQDIQTPLSTDFNLSLIIYDRFTIGASYRTNIVQNHDSFDAIFEAQLTQNLRMGYAYDYTLSDLQDYNSGTHELLISYEFGSRMKAYSSPRFVKYF